MLHKYPILGDAMIAPLLRLNRPDFPRHLAAIMHKAAIKMRLRGVYRSRGDSTQRWYMDQMGLFRILPWIAIRRLNDEVSREPKFFLGGNLYFSHFPISLWKV
ncbi:hypothetical protein VB151_16130 [Xanthomonas fragariae]|uniref:hypothetical protein n=1 Tax=Xanthomonas fragariae TaxID=48664 RepID=UPI000326E669|nr:hypothetical protein [Xanthomonas fragariae]ENZ95903.1 hypothetical protein O1K_07564 [Xanthomonas fragariae LMG 25863]MBL9221340.1 hypothetical protein [Xanthomonas fragariae]MDM7555918.1 hypothetical protein [Xanthomonas fragariae]MDM7579897.1 hypothetical protein [Xanthomonas fragariae]MEA5175132.1 hypothetical protein [Xanthomonas fragariae]